MSKYSNLFLFSSLLNKYNQSYDDLDFSDQACLNYVDKYLFSDNEKISDACFKIMLSVLEVHDKLSKNEEVTNTIIDIDSIYEGMNEKEKLILDTFKYACIRCIGIFSEENKKLRKERK